MKLFDTYTADVVELVANYTANRRRKEAAKAEERGVAARAEERFERAMLALEDIDVMDSLDSLEELPAARGAPWLDGVEARRSASWVSLGQSGGVPMREEEEEQNED